MTSQEYGCRLFVAIDIGAKRRRRDVSLFLSQLPIL